MNKAAYAEIFYRELLKVATRRGLDPDRQHQALYRLSLKLFDWLISEERLQFTTLFAKVAYIGHKYEIPPHLQYYLHHFRKAGMRSKDAHSKTVADIQFGMRVVAETIRQTTGVKVPGELAPHLPAEWPFQYHEVQSASFQSKVRVLVTGWGPQADTLLAKATTAPEKSVVVRYNVTGRNDIFNPLFREMKLWLSFPVTLNLIDVTIDEKGTYLPTAFVLEPDFLIDVSGISESFRGSRAVLSSFLLKKFWPFFPSLPLMLGNISNFFLDELLLNPAAEFRSLFLQLFELYPLVLSLFNDREIKDLYTKANGHFNRLKKVVTTDLPSEGISLDQASIEPAFYSEKYGLQGRLDLFFEGARPGIVELKSGKIYRPNIHGLGQNHFVQTLLYDLLIQSAYENRFDPANYILYSGAQERQLRFAPRVKAQQWEAIQFRNQVIILEKRLGNIRPVPEDYEKGRQVLTLLTLANCRWLSGFEKDRIVTFQRTLEGLTDTEARYFVFFVGFIAREHQLAKTGVHGSDKLNGQASLWLETLEYKVEKFEIINHLRFVTGRITDGQDHLLTFQKTETTSALANFRVGDIAVLYPQLSAKTPGMHSQIFKCTIIDIDEQKVEVRLRSKQNNQQIFRDTPHWNIEQDILDSSFVGMYRNLFAWASATSEKRCLLLGTVAPAKSEPQPGITYPGLTSEQIRILNKAIAAPDYFLLWGPPGTGKTSVMLKALVRYQFDHTDDNILLMAYTNRAVDEICEAIDKISEDFREHYFRVGSAYSTAPRFQAQLLKNKSRGVRTRKDLLKLIGRHRIVVGTLASMTSRVELLRLKTFQTAIIDEASQILEPSLVGLLPQFRKFILIGDHKQLPAVVAQDEALSRVADPALDKIGLKNLRNSFFERLYKRCLLKQWHWGFDQLSHQGRMHERLMQFPNRYFYGQSLHTLPPEIPHHLVQTAPLVRQLPPSPDELTTSLATKRVLFLDTPPDTNDGLLKTNRYEAAEVARVIEKLRTIYLTNLLPFDGKKVGVITPFRAQIARIKIELDRHFAAGTLPDITVDTVERYQGGARDIILISLCANSMDRLLTLTSYSDEGIDRKLNVALTRAREQIVLVGNVDLLSEIPLYKALIAQSHLIGRPSLPNH